LHQRKHNILDAVCTMFLMRRLSPLYMDYSHQHLITFQLVATLPAIMDSNVVHTPYRVVSKLIVDKKHTPNEIYQFKPIQAHKGQLDLSGPGEGAHSTIQ
jgi:hypothetical protein